MHDGDMEGNMSLFDMGWLGNTVMTVWLLAVVAALALAVWALTTARTAQRRADDVAAQLGAAGPRAG